MKKCSNCKETKEYSEFTKNKSNKNGYSWYCKKCKGVMSKAYRLKNRDKLNEAKRKKYLENPEKMQEYNLKRNYGINLTTFTRMRKEQNYCCLICGMSEKSTQRGSLVVDHNHTSKKGYGVRGLLCSPCNTNKVGSNTVSSIKNVLEYFKRHENV